MLVGILSDTHDQLVRTECAVRLLRSQGVEALIHCGDLTTPAIVAACAGLPFWFVLGNHDADNVPALQAAAQEHGATCLGWGNAPGRPATPAVGFSADFGAASQATLDGESKRRDIDGPDDTGPGPVRPH